MNMVGNGESSPKRTRAQRAWPDGRYSNIDDECDEIRGHRLQRLENDLMKIDARNDEMATKSNVSAGKLDRALTEMRWGNSQNANRAKNHQATLNALTQQTTVLLDK